MRPQAPEADLPVVNAQPVALFYRVRLMLAQMMSALLTTFLLLGLPPKPGSLAVALLLCGLRVAESRQSVRSPLTLAGALMGLALVVLNHAVDLGADAIHVPAIFFGVLFLVGGSCLLRGHPASMYYSEGIGTPALHWRTSCAWVAVYGSACLTSLLLPWRPDLFWLLPSLTLVGVASTLWLQLVDMGPAHRRARHSQTGALRIEEIEANREALLPFYEHYVREAAHSIKQGRKPGPSALDDQRRRMLDADTACWPHTRFFAAYDGQDMIGTISCMRRVAGAALGIESTVSRPASLHQAAAFGKVMQVARFSIRPSHRQRQDVFRGLLGAVIEYALEQDVALLVAQAYPSVYPVYAKIGFIRLSEELDHAKDTGAPLFAMAFNLARRVVCGHGDEPGAFRLDAALSPYLSERYFKRQSLRSIFRSRPVWALADADLVQLCLGARALAHGEGSPHGA